MDRKRTKLFSVTSADCTMQTFTVSGPGGGGKDTSQTGVRWIHPPSGAVGEGREERHQKANKESAWRKMAKHPKMDKWLRIQAAKSMGTTPEVDPKEIMRLVDQQIEDGLKNGLIVVEEINPLEPDQLPLR